MATYIVKAGDSLVDVCYNTTGSLQAIDAIMNANKLTTYTPTLTIGQVLTVPDVVYNSNAVQIAVKRPYNSTTIPTAILTALFVELKNQLQ